MPGDERFYVSKVVQAKVVDVGSRHKPKKRWWSGYEETTWEPEDSFLGSKYAVKTFWRKALAGPNDRNYTDLSKFRTAYLAYVLALLVARKQKPGPGRSSVGLITGTRVFALWPETRHYYSAVVQRRKGTEYVVRFDQDESELTVPLKHMRACAKLRTGDTIIMKDDTVPVAKINADGSLAIQRSLDIDGIMLSAWSVEAEWRHRKLSHKDIACAEDF
ncbi:hypothetical protein FB451DRAFT_1472670 [Mycena latifolia]|nr:hypothetical protein FB451DRAFT_1472670 [Mycena latifolia]